MIFLLTQPDSLYFIWQIEIFIFNVVQKHKYPIQKINILIGFDPVLGASEHSKELQKKHSKNVIFLYPDTRKFKEYSSTIRPHIIEKHFNLYPNLRTSKIFYADSDIIFRKLPNWDLLLNDDNWYASNTKSYMKYETIVDRLGYNVFEKMCDIVGISPQEVMENNNTGGAQYIIKNVPNWFWPKVENDSINIFKYLFDLLYKKTRHNFFEKKFDIWFTEMWVVYWNTILAKKKFKVHEELDFCWANETINCWYNTNILHYTGTAKDNSNIFIKSNYTFYNPFYADLSYISKESTSIKLVDCINEYRQKLDENRIDLLDTLCIIAIPSNEIHINQKVKIQLSYLNKYLKIKILFLSEEGMKIDECKGLNHMSLKEKNINELVDDIWMLTKDIDYIVKLSLDTIVPFDEIVKGIQKMKNTPKSLILKSKETSIFKTDILTLFIFEKVIDYKFLTENINKLNQLTSIGLSNNVLFFHKSVLNTVLNNDINLLIESNILYSPIFKM